MRSRSTSKRPLACRSHCLLAETNGPCLLPLLRFVRGLPLRRLTVKRPFYPHSFRKTPALAHQCQPMRKDHSRGSSTTADCSALRLRMYCNPIRPWGSLCFRRLDLNRGTPEGEPLFCPKSTSPTTRFIPPEEFHSSIAVPHHCGRCLPDVTPLQASATEVARIDTPKSVHSLTHRLRKTCAAPCQPRSTLLKIAANDDSLHVELRQLSLTDPRACGRHSTSAMAAHRKRCVLAVHHPKTML